MQQKMKELQKLTNDGIMNTERSGIRKPAPTVQGKVDQAQHWLSNPAMDDKGLGKWDSINMKHWTFFNHTPRPVKTIDQHS